VEFPERLVGDKAYDIHLQDEELAASGIEMIVPHRGNRKKPATQTGRQRRRAAAVTKPNFIGTIRDFFNIPAKGFSTHSESSSLGGEEFGIAESSRR